MNKLRLGYDKEVSEKERKKERKEVRMEEKGEKEEKGQ